MNLMEHYNSYTDDEIVQYVDSRPGETTELERNLAERLATQINDNEQLREDIAKLEAEQ